MIRDIIVSIDVGKQGDFAVDFAVSVAAHFGAHITGVAFLYEPIHEPLIHTRLVAQFQEAMRAEMERGASESIARFERKAREVNLSAVSHLIPTNFTGGSESFGRMARRFDLAVLGQGKPDDVMGENRIIQAAMFESGRPVLVVPYIQKEGLKLGRVMVCWDGSRAAARAVGDAMPFLARSGSVDIVVVADELAKSDEIPGFDVAAHLARHGIKTRLESIYAAGGEVTASILNRVEDESVDLLVMGGYGHSRLREFVLGGVTRGILEMMTVPVLLSH